MPVCQHLRKEVLQNILFYFTDGFDVSLNVCVTICCALHPSYTNYFNTGYIVLSEVKFFRHCIVTLLTATRLFPCQVLAQSSRLLL